MEEIRFIAAGGSLGGAGVYKESLREAMQYEPHFLAQDCGSTDNGPYYLGSGKPLSSRESMRHDVDLVLGAGLDLGVPVLIGSSGTAGADVQVDWMADIVKEIGQKRGRKIRTAVIYAEQDKAYLTAKLRDGRIEPLHAAPHFDEATIARSVRIVGMMGTEQLQKGLAGGVDLVLAGRCSDAALFAALPISKGFPAGLAWHAGKLLECGTMVCESKGKGVMLARLRQDELIVEPVGDNLRCTPQSIAAHSLYENSDPYLHPECSGTLDLTDSKYEPSGERGVRITGSRFHNADRYSVKLEGAELIGYQTIFMCGIRDPYIIENLDVWIAECEVVIHDLIRRFYSGAITPSDYKLTYKAYGRDAIMGRLDPDRKTVPHEIGLLVEVTAANQELATKVATSAAKRLLHHPIYKWKGAITGIAFAHNPPEIERGPVYRFTTNHIVLPDDPHEMFRTEFVELG